MGSDDLFKKRSKKEKAKKKEQKKAYRESILIICEGEKTEPNYFKSFPESGVKIEILGEGRNTVSLVDMAIKRWKKYKKEGCIFENLYVVMDRDSFPLHNYQNAFKTFNQFIEKTKNIKGKLIYSNEAFELWFLLHYNYYNNAISRSDYKEKLDKHLDAPYYKNDFDIYSKLKKVNNPKHGLHFAIKNAEKLRIEAKKQEQTFPEGVNPTTNVDELVKLLIDKYYENKKVKRPLPYSYI